MDFAMTAHHYAGENVSHWYGSRKLNGWHGVWIPWTRNIFLGTIRFYNGPKAGYASGLWTIGRYSGPQPIYAPDYFLDNMPGFCVEGELWHESDHIDIVKSICGQCANKSVVDTRWETLKFMAFNEWWDPYNRVTHNWQMSHDILKMYGDKEFFKVLPQSVVGDLDSFVKSLGPNVEGAMVVDPYSYYEHKRSRNLLKIKNKYDMEAKVIDVLPGEGKHSGRMGALKVTLTWDDKIASVYGGNTSFVGKSIVFNIGGGFSDEQRSANWIGKTIRFTYFGVTKDGVPVSANYCEET